MVGRHPIKCWSKTQRIIAKSSAESELYGVVKGVCEALGFFSLLEDLDLKAEGRVLMDASAAMGIIERRGLAKVRHVDTDVLWLQETEIRKKLPLKKIECVSNPADLMTTNVDSMKINKHMLFMNMTFESGRAGAAARLHSLQDAKDTWDMRGAGGRWIRRHGGWRRSLCTPCRIPKGPRREVRLQGLRVTRGVTSEGESFEVRDNWMDPKAAHRDLGFWWIGKTMFVEEDALEAGNGKRGRFAELVPTFEVSEKVQELEGQCMKLKGAEIVKADGVRDHQGDFVKLDDVEFGSLAKGVRWADV